MIHWFLIKFDFIESEELAAHQTSPLSNDTCRFKKEDDNVISFYNDQEIREDVVEFPAGAVLISRCADIGKFAMIGKFNMFRIFHWIQFFLQIFTHIWCSLWQRWLWNRFQVVRRRYKQLSYDSFTKITIRKVVLALQPCIGPSKAAKSSVPYHILWFLHSFGDDFIQTN